MNAKDEKSTETTEMRHRRCEGLLVEQRHMKILYGTGREFKSYVVPNLDVVQQECHSTNFVEYNRAWEIDSHLVYQKLSAAHILIKNIIILS